MSRGESTGTGQWWPLLNEPDLPAVFCIGHAGAWSRLFAPLAATVDGSLSIRALCAPGRERRLLEHTVRDATTATEHAGSAARSLAGSRCVVLGVCTGSRLAWRLVRYLESYETVVESLFVVDAVPPGGEGRFVSRLALLDGEIRERLAASGNTPRELLDDEEFGGHAVAGYRADLAIAAAPLPDDAPVAAPIDVVSSAESTSTFSDEPVSHTGGRGWERLSSSGARSVQLNTTPEWDDADSLAELATLLVDTVV